MYCGRFGDGCSIWYGKAGFPEAQCMWKEGRNCHAKCVAYSGDGDFWSQQALVARIHNACAPPPRVVEAAPPPAEPAPAGSAPPGPDLDESLAANKKRMRAISDPTLQEPKRVDGYADEYAANYVIIYDGELEVDGYSADSKVA